MNIHIEYNQEIIQKFKELNIAADHIGSVAFVLFCLYEDRLDLLDEFDDSSKLRRVIILYKQMERRYLIEKTKDSFILTKRGAQLVEYVKSKFDNIHVTDLKEVITQDLKDEVVREPQSVYTWIMDYIMAFPKEKRDNLKVVSLRMEKFIEEFSYTPEIIVSAAKLYNKYHDTNGTAMQYRRRSQYLIFEGRGESRTWDLATWCDKALEKQTDNIENLDFLESI